MLIKYLLSNIFRNTDVDSLTPTHVHESKLHNKSYDKLYKKYSIQNGLYFPFILRTTCNNEKVTNALQYSRDINLCKRNIISYNK